MEEETLNTAEETQTPETPTETTETKVEEKVEETPDLSIFDKVKKAEEEYNQLKGVDTEKSNDNFTYDEDLEQWVDSNGKLYDEKPQAESKVNFDPYNYAISQKENEINQYRNDVIASKGRECVEQFEKEFADIKDDLNATQWEVLKHDVIAPVMEELAEAIHNGNYSADILNQVKQNISNGIEARKSIYNLRKQVQENINSEKNANYPLESQNPTGVRSVESAKTFEGKSRKEKESILESIANKFRNLI